MNETIPVTITEAARAQVASWALESEFEQMIEHMKQTTPLLVSIRADVWERAPYPPSECPVILIAERLPPDDLLLPEDLHMDWVKWYTQTVPRVGLNITMHYNYVRARPDAA